MRAGILLGKRDLNIFKFLALGLAAATSLYRNFFRKEGANERTRKRAMCRCLARYKSAGLIRSATSPKVKDAVYALTPMGASYVADVLGWEVANVWQHIPRDGHVYHDIRVAQIARIVVNEIEELDGYELKFLEFEHYLKTLQKNEKGLCFPDLLLGFTRFDDAIILDIEIDCGSITREDFRQKINSFNPTILLVCNSPKRLDLLYKYLQQMDTGKNVYLTTIEQIIKEGFFRGRWLSHRLKAWVTLEEDNVKRRLV